MKNIKIIKTADEMRALSFQWKKEGYKVGFVPTMGFLHEGHLTLLERAKGKSGKVVLSIFVNPTQFGEGEDFDDYPRDLERDVELAATKGIDAVFSLQWMKCTLKIIRPLWNLKNCRIFYAENQEMAISEGFQLL